MPRYALVFGLSLALTVLALIVVATWLDSPFVDLVMGGMLIPLLLLTWGAGRVHVSRTDEHFGHVSRHDSTIDRIDEADHSDDEGRGATNRLAGSWSGTARIWPGVDGDTLKAIPVRMVIATDLASATVSPVRSAGDRVTAASVIEHDAPNGHLDLRLVVETSAGEQTFVTQLSLSSDRLVTEDETEAFTLELARAC